MFVCPRVAYYEVFYNAKTNNEIESKYNIYAYIDKFREQTHGQLA